MLSSVLFLVALLAVLFGRRAIVARRKLPLPPGPVPSLLWGNLLDIPKVAPWKKFLELSNTYGTFYLSTRSFQTDDFTLQVRWYT